MRLGIHIIIIVVQIYRFTKRLTPLKVLVLLKEVYVMVFLSAGTRNIRNIPVHIENVIIHHFSITYSLCLAGVGNRTQDLLALRQVNVVSVNNDEFAIECRLIFDTCRLVLRFDGLGFSDTS